MKFKEKGFSRSNAISCQGHRPIKGFDSIRLQHNLVITEITELKPIYKHWKNGEYRYFCPRCSAKYKHEGPVIYHLRECGVGAQCPYCPKVVTQRRNLAEHGSVPLKMDLHILFVTFPMYNYNLWTDFMSFGFGALADDSSSSISKLNRKNGQNFQCVKCGKWYSTKNIMLRHMNHECGVEKNIQCKYCSKMFLRKWNLKQHVKRIHENAINVIPQVEINTDGIMPKVDMGNHHHMQKMELSGNMMPKMEMANLMAKGGL
uniref:CSON004610 protein n=2 Tax=Culicoides sonorensis TaxID=179676 RepID=A0A336MPB0_CULSO